MSEKNIKSAKKQKKSGTLYDYLDWRGDIGFNELKPNEVDGLIFSMINYIDFSPAVEEDYPKIRPFVLLSATKKYLAAQYGKAKPLGLIIPKETITLLVSASKTERFGLTRPICHVNKVYSDAQMQFSATSFLLPGGATFVTFRGTDDTIVGWKESFNMSFMHPVPAQREAVEYLQHIAANTRGPIYVAGHSKGGNLAIYSAVKASEEVKARIAAVYSYDGPGFDAAFVASEDYIDMCDRIRTVIPQSSVIGMLLEHSERRTVIKSRASGLYQHSGFTWDVLGGSFIHLETTDEESQTIDRSLKDWLTSLTPEAREEFFDSLYEALTASNAKTLTELNSDKIKLIKAWNTLTPEARGHLTTCIRYVLGSKKVAKVKEVKETKEEKELSAADTAKDVEEETV